LHILLRFLRDCCAFRSVSFWVRESQRLSGVPDANN
jgi:hypothetical protein